MVKIHNGKGKTYDYSSKTIDTIFISKIIKKDFLDFCKSKKIFKSKIIEEFMKKILLLSKKKETDYFDMYKDRYVVEIDLKDPSLKKRNA